MIHMFMHKLGFDDILYLQGRLISLIQEVKVLKEVCQIKDRTIQDLTEELIYLHNKYENN